METIINGALIGAFTYAVLLLVIEFDTLTGPKAWNPCLDLPADAVATMLPSVLLDYPNYCPSDLEFEWLTEHHPDYQRLTDAEYEALYTDRSERLGFAHTCSDPLCYSTPHPLHVALPW